MGNHEQPPSHLLITKQGALLQTISRQSFDTEQRHALPPARLRIEGIYKAHSISPLLAEQGRAAAFDVAITRIQSLRSALTSSYFQLATLDDDYQPISTHQAKLSAKGEWSIVSNEEPIFIRSSTSRRLYDVLKYGYLLENDDTTIQDLISALSRSDTPTYHEVLEQLGMQPPEEGKQRPNPLFPTSES